MIFRLDKFFKVVESDIIFVMSFIDKMIKVFLNEKVKEIVITYK